MWTRAEIKTNAKEVLRKTYWTALIISLILSIAGANYSLSGNNNSNAGNSNTASYISYDIGNIQVTDQNISITLPGFSNTKIHMANPLNPLYRLGLSASLIYLSAFWGILSLLYFLLRIAIGYHLQVGGYKYFIHTANYREGSLRDLSTGFQGGHYWNIFKTMFLRDLFTFLWTLLFIIPGIIKKYAYTFVPYILADNPGIEPDRAIRISMDMTQGHKLDMFILNLSFLGWYILGIIAFGIGIAFVWPYENATYAQLYLILKQDAAARGIIDENEFRA